MLFRFGQEGVIIFFLLSGFVIFANESKRALHPSGYYLRRLGRIYPALIAAMLVSTIVLIDNGTFSMSSSWQELIGTIASIQDISSIKPGVIINPYLGNSPLWSLSYEVAFYAVFPLVLRPWVAAPSRTNHVIGIACSAAYVLYMAAPNHWCLVGTYFLIWWCGAMAADGYVRGERNILSLLIPFCWLLLLAIIAAGGVLAIGYHGAGGVSIPDANTFCLFTRCICALVWPSREKNGITAE
jgi:peptidoglycan/LPS O-acetylase OafA/YrhL